MKKVLTFALAMLLAGCQQVAYTGNPEYRKYAMSDLALLQMSTKRATAAEVCSRIALPQPGEEKVKHYPLSAEELQVLKDCLSKAIPAPNSTPEALNRRWKSEGIEIRLLGFDGHTLCSISQNSICSYSDSERYGKTLLCLPDIEMSVLRALPQIKAAKEYRDTEERYAYHCRHRAKAAEGIRQQAVKACSARVELETTDDKEYIELEEEEFQQLKSILATAEPLPAMTREAWDTPENHCMPLPPMLVSTSLQLLDDDEELIDSIPLDYSYFAASSNAAIFTQRENQGEAAALPDEQLKAFNELPFHARTQEKKAEMTEDQLRD
ncbi:MAG: hypothetical protein IKY91_07910 [Akkermansia sp.]|nr:hypothetical protein [Akkermansia sp.]